MKIGFDHCYQKIRHADEYFSLSKRGFTVDEKTVEHPGKQFCRFLRFNKPASSCGGMSFHYLEFAEIPDLEALKSTYERPIADYEAMEPGFSLSCNENLKQLFEMAREKIPSSEPKFEHKNYAWKEDDKSTLPGWNFLMFEQNIAPNIYVWCTEYEPNADRKPVTTKFTHPNSVDRFLGFAWNLPLSQLTEFQELTHARNDSGILQMDDGLRIYTKNAAGVPDHIWGEKKDYPFSAVILACTDWSAFMAMGQPDVAFKWNDRHAGLIRMPAGGWNIVVVESND